MAVLIDEQIVRFQVTARMSVSAKVGVDIQDNAPMNNTTLM
jgi:hypothetical protein